MSTISIAEAGRQLSQIVNRASYGREVLVLTSRGKPKAVLVGIDTFQQILGIHKIAEASQMSASDLQQGLRQALEEEGYDTPEKIVGLVREVKQEIAAAPTQEKPAP
jgi:prevent-host-death family protein